MRSPTRAPRLTFTHWATPLLTRTTNVRSVVVTMRAGHRDHQTQTRDLMQSEERRRSGSGADQRAGMHVALGDDAVERRLERQILFEVLDGLDLCLCGFD